MLAELRVMSIGCILKYIQCIIDINFTSFDLFHLVYIEIVLSFN